LSKEKRYFPNLNGIRCIAAMLVVFHHLEQAKHAFGMSNFYGNPVVQHAGRLGVGLFFVLSGFLITYLLLVEKGRFGDVDTVKFYLRRVFRIWPIYFLIILLSFFVFPHSDFFYFPGANEKLISHSTERLVLLALVLPNFAFVLYDLPYWCAQAWSIGVEEQFYYLWPWLVKYPRRRIPIIILFLAITATILFIGLYFLHEEWDVKQTIIGTFLGQFRIQTMALGGFCAYLVYYEKTKILDILFRKDVQIIVYTLLVVLFLSGVHFFGFLEVYAVFFGFFVLNASCNKNSIVQLENPVMNHLGKVSYGLYLYHVFVIVLTVNVLNKLGGDPSKNTYQFFLYLLSVLGSVAVASLSFTFLEKPLLAYKDKKFGR
jgi:peptidoglycan/LPS O-acetylase OafA/YrhL